MPSRRRFINDCATAALSAALLPVSLAAAPRRSLAAAPDEFGYTAFAALVNSRFVSRTSGGETQSLQLLEAVPDVHTAHAEGETFSLLFRGDAARPLPQDTYRFEHVRLGRFEMFIVPVGREDQSGCYYEAIFNRLPAANQLSKTYG